MADAEDGGKSSSEESNGVSHDSEEESAITPAETEAAGQESMTVDRSAESEVDRLNNDHRFQMLERTYLDVLKQFKEVKSQLQSKEDENASLRQAVKEIEQKEESNAPLLEQREVLEKTETPIEISKLESENATLASIIESKERELDAYRSTKDSLLAKIETVERERGRLSTSLFEAESSNLPLQNEILRLKQKNEIAEKHADWCKSEMESWNSQLFKVRQELSQLQTASQSKIAELQGSLESEGERVELLEERNESLEKVVESKIELLSQREKEKIESDENFKQEISTQTRLAEIYLEGMESGRKNIEELSTTIVTLEEKISQLANERHSMDTSFQQTESEAQKEIEELKRQLKEKEKEIAKLEVMGDVPSPITPRADQDAAAEFASGSASLRKQKLSSIEYYSLYMDSQAELRKEVGEKRMLENVLEKIYSELEDRATILDQQREMYEQATTVNASLQTRLERKVAEVEDLRSSAREAVEERNAANEEIRYLGQQIQHLLIERERAREPSSDVQSNEGQAAESPGAQGTSQSQAGASDRISQGDLLFRGVEELQENNRRLIAQIIELKTRNEGLSRVADLESQLDTAMEEVAKMKEERVKQTEMVEEIVRQRDTYKIMLKQRGALQFTQDMPELGAAEARNERDALEQLRKEFESYRKEREEVERSLTASLRAKEDEGRRFRIEGEHHKNASNTLSEKNKLLISSLDISKKEIEQLRLRNSGLQTKCNTIRQQLNSAEADAALASEKMKGLSEEKSMLLASAKLYEDREVKIMGDLQSVSEEKWRQQELSENVSAMYNSLERSSVEFKERVNAELESLRSELGLKKAELDNLEEKTRPEIFRLERSVSALTKELEGKKSLVKELSEQLKLEKERTSVMVDRANLLDEQLTLANQKWSSAEKEAEEGSTLEMSIQLQNKDILIENLKEDVEARKKQMEEMISFGRENEELIDALRTDVEAYSSNIKDKEGLEATLRSEILRIKEKLFLMNAGVEEKEKELENQRKIHEEAMKNKEEEVSQALAEANKAMLKEKDAIEELKGIVEMQQQQQDMYNHEVQARARDLSSAESLQDEIHNLKIQVSTLTESLKIEQMKAAEAEKREKSGNSELEAELAASKERIESISRENDLLHIQLSRTGSGGQGQLESGQTSPVPGGRSATGSEDGDEPIQQLIDSLRYQKSFLQEKCANMENEIAVLREREKQRSVENQRLLGDINNLKYQLGKNAKTVEEHADLMKKLAQMNALRDSNIVLHTQNESLESRISALNGEVSKMRMDSLSLQERLNASERNLRLAEGERDEKTKECDTWIAKLREWRGSDDAAALAELQEKHAKENAEFEAKSAEMNDKIKKLRIHCSAWKTKSESESQAAEELALKMGDLEKEKASAYEEANSKIEELNSKISEVEAELAASKALVAETEAKLKEKEDMNKALEAENVKVKETPTESEDSDNSNIAALKKKVALFERMKGMVISSKKKLESNQEEIASLKKSLAELSSKNDEKIRAVSQAYETRMAQLKASTRATQVKSRPQQPAIATQGSDVSSASTPNEPTQSHVAESKKRQLTSAEGAPSKKTRRIVRNIGAALEVPQAEKAATDQKDQNENGMDEQQSVEEDAFGGEETPQVQSDNTDSDPDYAEPEAADDAGPTPAIETPTSSIAESGATPARGRGKFVSRRGRGKAKTRGRGRGKKFI